MFERCFQWTIANGARVLFGAALVIFFVGFVQAGLAAYFQQLGNFTGPESGPLLTFAMVVLSGAKDAVVALIGALIVDQLSRRRSNDSQTP